MQLHYIDTVIVRYDIAKVKICVSGGQKLFFINAPEVYALLVQVEECEETSDSINCVDVKNEYWITNPKYCD